MLLNSKKAKIRELTNNGPVPEARIPPSDEEDEEAKEEGEEEEPLAKKPKGKQSAKTKATATKSKAANSKIKTTATSSKAAARKATTPVATRRTTSPTSKRTVFVAMKGKRKRTSSPDIDEDVDMQSGDETAEDSVQGDEERDVDVERTFGVRAGDDEGDVTEDEEL